jgi:hypothetical protein
MHREEGRAAKQQDHNEEYSENWRMKKGLFKHTNAVHSRLPPKLKPVLSLLVP